jgi:hypothetical protein
MQADVDSADLPVPSAKRAADIEEPTAVPKSSKQSKACAGLGGCSRFPYRGSMCGADIRKGIALSSG